MSINRLNPAACNNSLEFAPALANLNFDFSLWKVEAPKEFQEVGTHLSTFRREQAETGQPHMTARRLGALFEPILPSTPNLRRCYGQRASEICQVSALSPQTRKNYGMFSDRVGSDATSIWAAATSGSAAIAVHLLACLLARMFDDSAAIAIWDEIVRRRKDTIQSSFDETNLSDLTALQATRQTIGRAQLAEWDASARAWLRVADQVKLRQHTQLKLVLENVSLAINKLPDTYDSVMEAWKTCLLEMESLLLGRPQQASRGDVLLAISAWHLYPDLIVVAPSSSHVAQHDPLFQKKGLLTIGLEPRQVGEIGISWSLPLKYLRYYGAPITRTGAHNLTERSRLTVDEFLLVILGCVIAGDSEILHPTKIIRRLSIVAEMVRTEASAGSLQAHALIKGSAFSWLNLLLQAVENFEKSVDSDRLVAEKLISLGRRHEHRFLWVPRNPLFGLMEKGRFVGMFAQEEDRIDYLRRFALATFSPDQNVDLIIRYAHSIEGQKSTIWEYASAFPVTLSMNEQWSMDGDLCSEPSASRHYRWLDDKQGVMQDDTLDDDERNDVELGLADNFCARKPFDPVKYHAGRCRHIRCSNESIQDATSLTMTGEDFMLFKNPQKSPSTLGTFPYNKPPDPPDRPYRFCYGDARSAAVFVAEGGRTTIPSEAPKSKDLFYLLETDKFSPTNVVRTLFRTLIEASTSARGRELQPYFHRLKGVAAIAKLYSTFEGATINVNLFLEPLADAQWLKEQVRQYPFFQNAETEDASLKKGFHDKEFIDHVAKIGLPYELDRRSALACVAHLETSREYLDIAKLSTVMAISFEDSLYVSVALVKDPSTISLDAGGIIRVQGNIGRAGISYMVPPEDPLVREVSVSEWPSLSEDEFTGHLSNMFERTSLQIAFTEASIPIHRSVGSRDDNAHVVETLISLYDNGKWVADLNPWKTAGVQSVSKLFPCHDHYEHACEENVHSFTSIDNWLQLIDRNKSSSVKIMLTKDNVEARFAAMCLGAYLGLCTLVLPENPCWRCVNTKIQQDHNWRKCSSDEQGPIVIA